jgi:regulator of sigma E protease
MIRILYLFLGLSILITLHELGHFIAARWFKTRVEKFYLFFDFLFPFPGVMNFPLFKKQIGETEYGLGWFPFGGYVKIAGMIDESMDEEAMKLPPKPDEFRSKPAYQRLIIMLGGIIVNVLLGLLHLRHDFMENRRRINSNEKRAIRLCVRFVSAKHWIENGR